MDIFSVITLLGGLAFFLYGMNVMSNGLEKMAGSKLEKILRKMTSNRFKGLALGAGVTAIIQSSSAVTVMLVGLVNSGIMSLSQAISVTMGSNIGTTMTAWILSLAGIESDVFWMKLLKPANFSPIIAFIGVALLMMAKSQKKKDAGTICLGFAVLMFGMTVMSDAVEPLSEMPKFTNLLVAFQNPILGVVAGALFTALIQSSSASVGVLQVISMTGTLTFGSAIPIIMGQNIGTCVSALIASFGTNKNARRVAVVHVLFNTIGAVVCLIGWTIANTFVNFAFAHEAINPFYIAVIHSIFNITTTVMLIPFAKQLEKMARVIIPDAKEVETAALLDERLLTVPSFAVAKAMNVTKDMASLSKEVVFEALDLIDKYDANKAKGLVEKESLIDDYEDKLGTYLVDISKCDVTEKESNKISRLLYSIGDFERIGDHAINLLRVAQEMNDKKISFSPEAKAELRKLNEALHEILDVTIEASNEYEIPIAETIEPLEEVIDVMINKIKNHHIDRLRRGNCTIELGFILTDLLTSCERISDHCSNIGAAIIGSQYGIYEAHEYLSRIKQEPTGTYADNYAMYLKKYVNEK